MNKLKKFRYVLLAGDYNVDLLTRSTNRSQLQTVLNLFNLSPSVTKPTRFKTCLDNIFINFSPKLILNKETNIFTGIGDHQHAQLISFHTNSSKTSNKIFTRTYCPTQISSFMSALENADFSNVYNQANVDVQLLHFYHLFLSLFHQHFPYKLISTGNKKQKPWITRGIIVSSARKRSLYNLTLYSVDPSVHQHYKNYSKILQKVVRDAKKNFTLKTLRTAPKNKKIKTVWNVVKTFSKSDKSRSKESFQLKHQSRIVDNPVEVANIFNDFWVNIAPRMGNNPPPQSTSSDPTLPPPQSTSSDPTLPPPQSTSSDPTLPPPQSTSSDPTHPPPQSTSSDPTHPQPQYTSYDPTLPPPQSTTSDSTHPSSQSTSSDPTHPQPQSTSSDPTHPQPQSTSSDPTQPPPRSITSAPTHPPLQYSSPDPTHPPPQSTSSDSNQLLIAPEPSMPHLQNFLQLPPRDRFQFFLEPCTPLEVVKIVKGLQNKTSCGEDSIPMTIIKESISILAEPLSFIFNSSFSTSTFPKLFKSGIAIPIHKKGSRDKVQNFRCINLLNNFGKILEKIVATRLTSFQEHNNLLTNHQFGFRPGRSTSDAVSSFLHQLDLLQSSGKHAVGVFCDLSRAFDCVNHSILIDKLPFYGIPISTFSFPNLSTSTSSSADSSPNVPVSRSNNVFSDTLPVSLGVPQGSVLGPLLFVLYVNDLPLTDTSAHFTLFAGDTTILVGGDNYIQVCARVASVLSNVQRWFGVNQLTLNESKTSYLYFNSKPSTILSPIRGPGFSISPASEVKFLGLTLDEKLKWQTHTQTLKTKLASAVFAIRSVKQLS
ncbi:hypothetical protein WDU94_003700 [Cyamophila willieti]